MVVHSESSNSQAFLARLRAAAEMDAELVRASKPAIEKLKMLPDLSKKLHNSTNRCKVELVRNGLLTTLRIWLEPLPDNSLPSLQVRTTILQLLPLLPINPQRDELKRSGLGKVIMFLAHHLGETTANKKIATQLVEKWSRDIFNISDNPEDLGKMKKREMNQKIAARKKSERGEDNKKQDIEHQPINPPVHERIIYKLNRLKKRPKTESSQEHFARMQRAKTERGRPST